MTIDYLFIVEMLRKYYVHLENVKFSINKNMEQYDKQIKELTRLADYKPETYTKELEKVKQKVVEADLKLSYIVPNQTKINEQIKELNKLI